MDWALLGAYIIGPAAAPLAHLVVVVVVVTTYYAKVGHIIWLLLRRATLLHEAHSLAPTASAAHTHHAPSPRPAKGERGELACTWAQPLRV